MAVEFRGRVRRWREDRPDGLAVVDVPPDLVDGLGGRRQMRVTGTLDGAAFTGSTMLVAGVEVEQADQGHAGRATVVEQLIERGADGAPTHQHVVDQHQVLAFDLERQLGGLYLRVQAILGEIVAVEGHIENAQRVLAAQGFEQCLGDPDAAGADADKAWFADLPLVQVAGQGGGHLR
jgi:hypothetical protein